MAQEIKSSFIVIAGGRNSRFFGRDKAFIRVLGKPMIERVINAGRGIFDEFVIVSNSPEKYKTFTDTKVVFDIVPDAGPLGGLYTALKITKGEVLMMVSCDMPYLDKDLIATQLEIYRSGQGKVVVPLYDGFSEPLHCVFSKEILRPLELHLMSLTERKLIDFFLAQPHQFFNVKINHKKKNPFLNINSYHDLELHGIHGYIGVLGFGRDVSQKNLFIAGQTGKMLAETGWGIITGNTDGTFRAACSAAIESGGFPKLIYSREDLTGDDSLWPLKEEARNAEEKHKRMAQIMSAAIVIGGGEGTLKLINFLKETGKPVVYINETGGVTGGELQGCVRAESPQNAVEILNIRLLGFKD